MKPNHANADPQPGPSHKPAVDVSFVILSWNSARFLNGCLTSIQNDFAGSHLTYEVFMIDNGSKDGSLEILAGFQAQGHPLTVIPLGHNTGTTFSRNIGMRMARGRYICVMDSDINFCQEKTLETLIAALDQLPKAGIIAPMLNYPSGNHQKSFDQFPTIGNKLKRIFFLRKMERIEGLRQFVTRNTIEVDYVISAFWLFNRDLMDSIGLLDEKIFYAPEDVDYCLRSWLSGSPVVFCSGATVIHNAQEISRKKPFSKSGIMHLQGLYYYFRKYGYCLGLARLRKRVQAAVAAKEKLFAPPPGVPQHVASAPAAPAPVSKSIAASG